MKLLLRALTLTVAIILVAVMLQTWLKEVSLAFERGTTHHDSLQFYTGATLVRSGRADDLYDLEAQRSLQRKLLPEQYRLSLGFDFIPFVSPPFVALALGPFSGFSLPSFYLFSGIANLILLAVLLIQLQAAAVGWPESWRLALMLLILMWLPVTWSLREGQVSLLLAVSLISGYLALRSRQGAVAGCVLGLLWVKPQYAVLVLPALVLWGQRRAAGTFIGSSFLLLLASLATVGFDGFLSYAKLLTSLETRGAELAMFPANYHTLSGFLLRTLNISGWVWAITACLLAILVYWRVRRGFSLTNYALMILASVLVSPHTHLQDLTVLLPAVTLGWEATKHRPEVGAVWVSAWSLVGFGFYALVLNRYLLRDGPLLTVPAMLLAVGLLVFQGRTRLPPVGNALSRIEGTERQ